MVIMIAIICRFYVLHTFHSLQLSLLLFCTVQGPPPTLEKKTIVLKVQKLSRKGRYLEF